MAAAVAGPMVPGLSGPSPADLSEVSQRFELFRQAAEQLQQKLQAGFMALQQDREAAEQERRHARQELERAQAMVSTVERAKVRPPSAASPPPSPSAEEAPPPMPTRQTPAALQQQVPTASPAAQGGGDPWHQPGGGGDPWQSGAQDAPAVEPAPRPPAGNKPVIKKAPPHLSQQWDRTQAGGDLAAPLPASPPPPAAGGTGTMPQQQPEPQRQGTAGQGPGGGNVTRYKKPPAGMTPPSDSVTVNGGPQFKVPPQRVPPVQQAESTPYKPPPSHVPGVQQSAQDKAFREAGINPDRPPVKAPPAATPTAPAAKVLPSGNAVGPPPAGGETRYKQPPARKEAQEGAAGGGAPAGDVSFVSPKKAPPALPEGSM